MDRRRFVRDGMIMGGMVAALGGPIVGGAHPAGKTARIGYLSPGHPRPADSPSPFLAALHEELAARGWVVGQNLAWEPRYAGGDNGKLEDLASEVAASKVDVILTWSQGLPAARRASSDMPIVFLLVTDPVGLGYVESLRRPGANVTGVSNGGPELIVKRLQIVKDMVPAARKVLVLAHDRYKAVSFWSVVQSELGRAARDLKVGLDYHWVSTANEIDGIGEALRRHRTDALMNIEHQMFFSERNRIVSLAARLRRPALWDARAFAEAGGLASFGPDFLGIWRTAGRLVDRILRGARPADLPVEQPTKFELLVNLRTARELGMTIPPGLRLRADQVIE